MVPEPSGIGAGLLRFADLGCAQVLEGAGSPADCGYRQSVLCLGTMKESLMAQRDAWNDPPPLPVGPGTRPFRRLGNYAKTAVLLAALTALCLAVGQWIGRPRGLMFARFFVLSTNFFS